jgi:hypothetical protein
MKNARAKKNVPPNEEDAPCAAKAPKRPMTGSVGEKDDIDIELNPAITGNPVVAGVARIFRRMTGRDGCLGFADE